MNLPYGTPVRYHAEVGGTVPMVSTGERRMTPPQISGDVFRMYVRCVRTEEELAGSVYTGAWLREDLLTERSV